MQDAMKSSLVIILVVLLAAESFGAMIPVKRILKKVTPEKKTKADAEIQQRDLALTRLPLNQVAVLNDDLYVIFTCSVQAPSVSHRLQWLEFAQTPNGGIISENEYVFPNPGNSRYSIIHTGLYDYDLRIQPVLMVDGGRYQCVDAASSGGGIRLHNAQLTVLSDVFNCSSTVRDSGVVLDTTFNTHDCTVDYKGGLIPNFTWTGPGPFNSGYVSTDTQVWAGIGFNVTREMDTLSHVATLYFTNYFLPIPGGDYATNIPTQTYYHQAKQMFVFWPPVNLVIQGIKPNGLYLVGDQLLCQGDSMPIASYQWRNGRTNEITQNQLFTITPSMYGFEQIMLCQATNTIEGTVNAANVYTNVTVPLITTPVPTVPPPTTTPHPPTAPCDDLTGGWKSVYPTAASLCIKLDLNNNAVMTGMVKNGTNSFWMDLIGRAQVDKYDQIGFNGISPFNYVSSFVGECHKCYGVEYLLINAVTRTKGSPCGTPGPVEYSEEYEFQRGAVAQCINAP